MWGFSAIADPREWVRTMVVADAYKDLFCVACSAVGMEPVDGGECDRSSVPGVQISISRRSSCLPATVKLEHLGTNCTCRLWSVLTAKGPWSIS